jgi:IclR family pca regulon transcriptional regulator
LYDGSRLPAYCTSVGKVLLAGLADDELNARLERLDLEPITRKTITSKKDLWRELMEIRKRGYAISDRELSMDLYSVAVPVVDEKGAVVGSINVTTAAGNLNLSFRKKILQKLFEKGKLISSLLGYQGKWPSIG